MDKHSPNARSMLLSLVPSLVKKCVYYATNLEIMLDNIIYVMRELTKKEYPLAWWRRRFFHSLRLEGYNLEGSKEGDMNLIPYKNNRL